MSVFGCTYWKNFCHSVPNLGIIVLDILLHSLHLCSSLQLNHRYFDIKLSLLCNEKLGISSKMIQNGAMHI